MSEAELEHKLDPGGSLSGAPSKKFDEGLVKRDQKGRFSTKDVNAAMDELWLADIETLVDIFAYDHIKEMSAIMDKYAGDRTLLELQDHPEILKKIQAEGLVLAESLAKKELVSPSGTKRVKFFPQKFPGSYDLDHKVVSYNGPNPHPDASRRVREQIIQVQRHRQRVQTESEEESRGMFNPSARLDRSQIKDLRQSEEGSDAMTFDELAQLGEEALAHFGVKGMRWGVRRTPEQLRARQGKLASKKEKLGSEKDKLITKRSKAQSKQAKALAKQSKVQTKVLGRVSKGKTIPPYQRAKLKRVNRKAVKALKRTNRVERHIRRIDRKVNRMDKETIRLGEEATRLILENPDN